MKFSSSAVRIVTVLGAGRRGGFLAEAAVAAIRGGGRENGESFGRWQGDNELELMALEGQKKKAADEFLLSRRGSMDEEGGEDNNKTTAMVESRMKAWVENETNAKGK